MLVYRVAPRKHASDLSGEGARLAGGRWNEKGTPVLYTSEHPALAFLETLPSFDLSTTPPGVQLVEIEIPDAVTVLTISADKLPADWKDYPHKPSTVLIGQKWIKSAKASVLKVPTVMAPSGWNLLLNPVHAELLGRMAIKNVHDWEIDHRLLDKLNKK